MLKTKTFEKSLDDLYLKLHRTYSMGLWPNNYQAYYLTWDRTPIDISQYHDGILPIEILAVVSSQAVRFTIGLGPILADETALILCDYDDPRAIALFDILVSVITGDITQVDDSTIWDISPLVAQYDKSAPYEVNLSVTYDISALTKPAEPEDDNTIKRYGTDRDMTRANVKDVVRRCTAFLDRGGKVTEWHRFYSDDKYSLETLRDWLDNPAFLPD
jgi:hypothetical protein